MVSPVAPLRQPSDEPSGIRRARPWASGAIYSWVSTERVSMARSAGEVAWKPQVYCARPEGDGLHRDPEGTTDFTCDPGGHAGDAVGCAAHRCCRPGSERQRGPGGAAFSGEISQAGANVVADQL